MNLDLVAQHITPDFVIDCGANVGGFYQQAKTIWPDARYVLIEGNPECSPILEELGVVYHIALLSDREKDVTFYTRKGAPTCTGASMYREQTSFYEGDKAVPSQLRTITLDELPLDLTGTVLLKLDCQGSELDIMRGGSKVLAAAQGVICEVSYVEYNKGAPYWQTVDAYIRGQGFVVAGAIEKIVHPLNHELHIQSSIFYMRP